MGNKYRYAKVKRGFVVFFCLFSIFVVIMNIIGLSRYGYISIPNLLIIISSFIGTLITTVYLFSGYRQFDLRRHKRLVKRLKSKPIENLPKIDVFLPCAGEDLDTLIRTYKAVTKLDYPKEKTCVYVLDDKGVAGVELLAKRFRFNYFSRPNKGENKKAGNLRYGYERSRGKYILILDADFAPRPAIINELLPYMERDPRIGISQSPQDFDLNEKEPLYVQKGDIGIQEFFYRICQVARNSFNATICTGTNALYRRRALQKAGGFYQIEHSEDSHTGINLVKSGYRIIYVPIVLAKGYCPSNYYALFKQRSRWCQGSLTLMRSQLFRDAKLNLMARICYFSGFYYYLNSFVIMLLPFHSLYLLSTPEKSNLIDNLFFLPNVFYILFSYTTFYYPRFSFSILGNQLFFYWTYMYMVIKSLILGKNEAWTATGTKQKKNFSYRFLLSVVLTYIGVYWFWFLHITVSDSFVLSLGDFLLLFWIAYNMITHISFIYGLVASELYKLRPDRILIASA